MDAERNNFVMSNAAADFGKDVETVDDRDLTVEYDIKDLRKATNLVFKLSHKIQILQCSINSHFPRQSK